MVIISLSILVGYGIRPGLLLGEYAGHIILLRGVVI